MSSAETVPNRLLHEKSPYLLQHAYNPVDWYPWGDEAFELARRDEKLIFLSVGYSTCHWCHVMAHESFEDPEVAAALARSYVAVKVDREERPDIDHLYMEFCQRLTGRGGWPLTVVLMPDGLPVFAATYLPKNPHPGYAGLVGLLEQIATQARAHEEKLREAGRQLAASMQPVLADTSPPATDPQLVETAMRQLRHSFDTQHGGFGTAPKFPSPHHLSFLLRCWLQLGTRDGLSMVEKTLAAMAAGGIHDHLGGGFHRYATDAGWHLPHFEKMLYDQAGISEAYLEAFAVTGNPDYAATASGALDYVLRELADPAGGFHAAEDADSEGEEGLYYLWRKEEIDATLDAGTAALFCRAYGVAAGGNYRDEASGQPTGKNVLHRAVADTELAAANATGPDDMARRLAEARRVLLEARGRRPPPHRDDKILAAWNGLIVSALSKGARLLKRRDYLAAARGAADFMLGSMRRADGRLLRRWRDGEAGIPAFAEDYAFLSRGLLDLYRAGFDSRYLAEALGLAGTLQRLFAPDAGGALFDTAADSELLVARPRTLYDGAIISANTAAVEVFARLYLLSGDPGWRAHAEAILAQLLPLARQTPQGFTGLLAAASFLAGPSREVVIVGTPGGTDTLALLNVVDRVVDPGLSVLLKAPGDSTLAAIAPYTADMVARGDSATAFLCSGRSCREPTSDPAELQQQLQSR